MWHRRDPRFRTATIKERHANIPIEPRPGCVRLEGAVKIRSVAATLLTCLALSLTCVAGPVDFGLAEYNAALAARNLKWKVKYEVTIDPPETYRIEPYAYGGAHITGGDLRGLMYGLLEAADQIRSTGRMKQVHGAPATAIRAIRRFAGEGAGNDVPDWRLYFETLARDRFNRFTLVFTAPPALDQNGLDKLRTISQAAADDGVDFTLGLWYELGSEPSDNLGKIIAACPSIRAVQIRTAARDLEAYRARVFQPLHNAGRRIALDPDPEVVSATQQEGVALRTDASAWPPNFEIEAPVDFETHSEFYWLWGRLAYDPKSKPAHGENSDEFRAAVQIVAEIAMAKAPSNDWIASIGEAVGNRVNSVASAKRTPLEIWDSLASAAAQLQYSGVPDLRLLATLARDQATQLRDAYDAAIATAMPSLATPPANAGPEALLIGGSASGLPAPPLRPQLTHAVVHTSPPDQPINLTLQIAPIKDVRVVRLHYRPLDSFATSVVERPAAASVSFTIPAAKSDLLYYFEILYACGGWFEPDPTVATPYHAIRVEPKQ